MSERKCSASASSARSTSAGDPVEHAGQQQESDHDRAADHRERQGVAATG